MKIRALKTYRCGEPAGAKTAPPKKLEDLMVKHLGAHGRIFAGGSYPNLPDSLAKALIEDKAAEAV